MNWVEKVLRATGFEYTDNIWWRTERQSPFDDDDPLQLLVNCNDVFFWASADCEEITEENHQSLIDTITECEAIVGRYNANDAFPLWVARVRAMRPQSPVYKHLDPRLWHLFDAAGPEREQSIGNPGSLLTIKQKALDRMVSGEEQKPGAVPDRLVMIEAAHANLLDQN